MKIYKNVCELIGRTPIMRLSNYERKYELNSEICAKLEFFNPAGSAKDRIAREMIETAEAEGRLKTGSVIIEPTSGNTGIGLASVAASKGYKVVLTMPDTMSVERRKLLAAYGAEIVLTEGKFGMNGAIKKAEELARRLTADGFPALPFHGQMESLDKIENQNAQSNLKLYLYCGIIILYMTAHRSYIYLIFIVRRYQI